MNKNKLYMATLKCEPAFHFYFYSKHKKGSTGNEKDFEIAFRRRFPDITYTLLSIERVKKAKIKELK